ncbi:MAG: hypothetical protein EXR47_07350 [Dehalococcoidia bacterium]|nr:hypothetical protein [Dehalococcoidia bacterium]
MPSAGAFLLGTDGEGTVSIGFLLVAVITASVVEMVEAMTIILASGITRGWRSTLEGTAVALVALAAIVAVLGPALVNFVPIHLLRVVVGTLLLIFGLQWLRKAVLRASGYKSLHDEAGIYAAEVKALSKAPAVIRGRRDPVAFAVSFKGVFLEGLEVIVIVISFGVPAGHVGIAAAGAVGAALVVGVVGLVLAKPLAGVPENSMKLVVAVMLVTFGAFWMGEGAGIEWPGADLFILVLLALFSVVSFIIIRLMVRAKGVAPPVART